MFLLGTPVIKRDAGVQILKYSLIQGCSTVTMTPVSMSGRIKDPNRGFRTKIVLVIASFQVGKIQGSRVNCVLVSAVFHLP